MAEKVGELYLAVTQVPKLILAAAGARKTKTRPAARVGFGVARGTLGAGSVFEGAIPAKLLARMSVLSNIYNAF